MDYSGPIEVAPRVWWVGNYMEDDLFQCHVYLIEHGDQSVLIDPGSNLTFNFALEKIQRVIPFDQIRYFICHHQDPDITGALPGIDKMITRDDAILLSHWRGIALLKHYGLKLPMECVEKRGWTLDLGGRILDFHFTPYLHFPGAFVTYDRQEKLLFSSDIFGGFTEEWDLYAKDESYFEAMRPFHEHYMPSKDILMHSLIKLETLQINAILPQHGSIIRKELVKPLFSRLKSLDCGLLLMAQTSTEVNRLSKLNHVLREFLNEMVVSKDFSTVVDHLINNLRELLSLKTIQFYLEWEEGKLLHIEESAFRTGHPVDTTEFFRSLMGLHKDQWLKENPLGYLELTEEQCDQGFLNCILLPLFGSSDNRIFTTALLAMEKDHRIDDESAEMLRELQIPMGVAVERELLYRKLEEQKQQFYEKSIRDPLTGLYTRNYMVESATRLCKIHAREKNSPFAVAIFDLDNFKGINDTYGHVAGDRVLERFGAILREESRAGDMAVRYGGEEFALFMMGSVIEELASVIQRILNKLEKEYFSELKSQRGVTASAGLAMHRQDEDLEKLIFRADKLLYLSKTKGKNQLNY